MIRSANKNLKAFNTVSSVKHCYYWIIKGTRHNAILSDTNPSSQSRYINTSYISRKIKFRKGTKEFSFHRKRKKSMNGRREREREKMAISGAQRHGATIWTGVSFVQAQHCHGIKNQWHFRIPVSFFPSVPWCFPFFFFFFLHLWNSVTWNGHFYSTESALFFNRLVSPPRLKTTNFLGPRITHTFLGFVVSPPHNTPGIRGWAVRQ